METPEITIPEEAVDVLIRQGGYEDIIKRYFAVRRVFPSWPLRLDKVRRNAEFVRALLDHQVKAANAHADVILDVVKGRPGSILDVGSGLGVVDLVLQQRIESRPDVYLLDKGGSNESLRSVKGGFHQDYVFTANLGISRDMFSKNHADLSRLHFVEPSKEAISGLPKIDLVLSITSWGFHYPVETYWDAVRGILHEGSQLFIDIRKGQGGFELLEPFFGTHDLVKETETMLRVCFSEPQH